MHIDEGGQFILINSKFISSDGQVFKRTSAPLSLLRIGDVAMVLSDVPNGKALAKCYLVESNETYSLNQRICSFRSKVLIPRFLYWQLNRHPYLLSFDNGENQTNLRLNQVLSCPLVVPPLHVQQSLADTLDSIAEKVEALKGIFEGKLAALDELKKSLLHRAFNGDL
jgi:type I restriction enzyme S subunit